MLPADIKRIAFAAMDEAQSFELHVAATPPHGDRVVEIVQGTWAQDVLPAARFVGRMARTFFADKLMERVSDVPPDGSVALYVVARLPELGDTAIAPLDRDEP